MERNLNGAFEFDSGSDGSAQDNDSQPTSLPSQSSLQITSESSDLPEDAASFMRYDQMARRIQKKVEATLSAEIQKIRQESREERHRHAEEMKAAKAREEALKRMVLTLQVNNPEAKIQADALCHQTRLAERRRRRCRALREQILRMHRAENKMVLRDYTRIVLERMTGLCDPGGKVLMSLGSIAASGSRAAQQPEAQQAGSKRKWRFSKFAGKHVVVKLPSPFMSRLGKDGEYIGGLEANPKRLVAMVLNWCQHNLSIRATCRVVAYELSVMQ